MEITADVKKTLESLSKVNLSFMEFIGKNPACLNRANFKELEALRNRFHLLQPWPTFINRERKDIFRAAGVKLFDLIKSIPRRLFDNDARKMSSYYELPVSVTDLQMEGVTDRHLDNLLARGDFVLSPSGLKCLEYNIAGNLGGHLLPLWESLYLKNPLILQFLKEYRVNIRNENLLELFLAHGIRAAESLVSRFCDAEMNACLVLKSETPMDTGPMTGYLAGSYKKLLQREHPSLKGEIFLCDFSALEVKNDRVYYREKPVHVLTEWHFGVVPPRIMKVFKAGNVRIMNGPVTNLLSNKLNLALLSEHRDSVLFSDEERETIKKFVPWSRKIVPGETTYGDQKIRLEDFIRSHKDALVIKPALGYGGDGVYIGKNVSEEEWEKRVQTALIKKNWLVQQLLESGPALYRQGETGCAEYDQAWGFFIFGSQYAGTFLRISTRKNAPRIINTHQGAEISVVFEVDE
ncbi:MAG: circularly permuted type 2 ATP-grasp protein [bacterium]|nr:circularly permuted type 2 ATP-grasp protein [bacterium]